MNIKAINITLWFLLGICSTVRAELIVPSEKEIRQLAKATVAEQINNITGAKVVIEPQMLGARMTPPRCEYPLQASMASNREINRNNTVRISCTTPDLDYPWQMFVAVRIEILRPVVVADAYIDPGQLLATDNLRLEWMDETQLRGSQFEDVHDLLGTRAKRRIAKDSAIFAANVCYVCRGDKVKILARAPGFIVKTYGEALQDGVVGDQIRIKNTHSNKQLDAIITAIAAVEVKI